MNGLYTIVLLILSNVFMTLAWYGHLKLFIGNGGPFTLVQLKVVQECISLAVFAVIANIMFQGQSLHWNHILAFLFIILAVYLVFMK